MIMNDDLDKRWVVRECTLVGITSLEEDSSEFGYGIGTPKKASLSRFEEGGLVESAGSRAITTGTREATLGGGEKQLKKGRREIMPYLRFTKVIINHFLSIYKSVPKGLSSGLHSIKDDGVLNRMKFLIISEDFQEYGRAIPVTMLTDQIKQSDTYQMFIKYSIGLIPLKKSRGKGSQGKKLDVTLNPASVEVSHESDPEPARRQTSRKSISLTEAAEEEAARQVHATQERIVTKSDPKHAVIRPSGITFKYTSNVSKKISPDPSQKLKCIQTLTTEEQLAADTMQVLKASRKSSRSQPHAEGSSEGTGVSPGVPDKSTVILTTSSEGNSTKLGVPDKVQSSSAAKADWGSEEESGYSEKETTNEETDDEETDDEFVHNDEYVHDNVDEEMKDVEVADTWKGDEEITDTTKADAKKIEEVKDDNKKAELPPSSSNLSVSSGFEIPHIQSPSILTIPVSVIPEPTVLSPIPEIPTKTLAITLPPPPSVTTIIHVLQHQSTPIPTPPITTIAPTITTIPDLLPGIIQRVYVLEKDVQELKEVDHTTILLASLISKIPSAVNAYLGSNRDDDNKDEDSSARPNQGKKTKRSRTKESEPSKKSSTTKESSKGKSLVKTFKSGESVTAEELVEELAFEMASDDIEQTVDDVVNDV
ncbi:hypothetical protein Tco_0648994 [Tanacetum coccineum]